MPQVFSFQKLKRILAEVCEEGLLLILILFIRQESLEDYESDKEMWSYVESGFAGITQGGWIDRVQIKLESANLKNEILKLGTEINRI